MDDKLKKAIAEKIEFRFGRHHSLQPLLNDIEHLVDQASTKTIVVGYITRNADNKIGWEPNVANILAMKPFKNVAVFLSAEANDQKFEEALWDPRLEDNDVRAKLIQRAIESRHTSERVEVDEDTYEMKAFSPADEGCWVRAWVWVPW